MIRRPTRIRHHYVRESTVKGIEEGEQEIVEELHEVLNFGTCYLGGVVVTETTLVYHLKHVSRNSRVVCVGEYLRLSTEEETPLRNAVRPSAAGRIEEDIGEGVTGGFSDSES